MKTISIGNKLRDRPTKTCGAGSPTLIIASVGTSSTGDTIAAELAKVRHAAELGADAVTDHSFYGDIPAFHRAIADQVDVLLSAVTCYEFAAHHQRSDWSGAGAREPIDLLEDQLSRGLDLVTVHASLLRAHTEHAHLSKRLIPTTSKGGGIVSSYMRSTGRENPYFEYFDDLLAIFKSVGATISLGTTFRTATVCDTWDDDMATEIRTMSGLVKRSLAAGVPIMVEGFGHASLDAIPTYVRLTKAHCHQVPYRVLPMATDRALGFDHLSGAIAASAAVAAGADAVTAMSRAEHIGLPEKGDLEEAIIATRIAAGCGELVKLRDFSADAQMSRTRWAQGCKGDWTAAIYPDGAEEALRTRNRLDDQLIQCGMCGDFCGINAGIATVKLSRRRPRSVRDEPDR
jgi:phosphomethylpyrimidine synthase